MKVNKMHKKVRVFGVLLFTSLLTCSPLLLKAQDVDCSEKLKLAESSYEVGNIEDVEAHVSECLLNQGFITAEREEALKLLVLVGLFEDNFDKAERNMIALLKTNPDFKPKSTDPAELKNLYSLFRTDPIFTFGGRAGLNVGYATTSKYFSVWNSDSTNDLTASRMGFQVGVNLNYRIAGGLYVNMEPTFASLSIADNGTSMFDSAVTVQYAEQMTLLGGQFGLSNEFRKGKKVKPTIFAGIGYYVLQSTNTKIQRLYVDESGLASVQESEINLRDNRALNMYTFSYGLDLKIKSGRRGHVFIGVRHNLGLNNITRDRYNDDLMYRYYLVLDDQTMNSIQFDLGYLQSVYKPKILKRKVKKNEK